MFVLPMNRNCNNYDSYTNPIDIIEEQTNIRLPNVIPLRMIRLVTVPFVICWYLLLNSYYMPNTKPSNIDLRSP